MSQTTVAFESTLPAPVRRFCVAHNLLPHLQLALGLAESTFEPAQNIQVELETDPETDDEAVVITVSVVMPVDEVVRRKLAYTQAWVSSAPAGAVDKIRLLFDIL